jgi:hypothetical protein
MIGPGVNPWHCPQTGQQIRFPATQFTEHRLSDEQWLTWTQSEEILPYLHRTASTRKLRLLYCAFCRLIWDRVAPEHRRVVETAEHYADGLEPELQWREVSRQSGFRERTLYGLRSLWFEGIETNRVLQYIRNVLRPEQIWTSHDRLTPAERKAQCDVIRELFGQLHWDVRLQQSWLTWNDGIVPALARGIRKQGGFENLPILADALEEAGCHNSALLSHCRQPGEHLRGCWPVDLIVGNKPLRC